jgi:hypothetical protein
LLYHTVGMVDQDHRRSLKGRKGSIDQCSRRSQPAAK